MTRQPHIVPRKSVLVELQAEAGKAVADDVVEDLPVLLRGFVVQRRRVVLAQLDQLVGSRLDEVEEVPVSLLGLASGSMVVSPQRRLHVGDQARLFGREEIELPLDEIDEAPGHLPMLPAP
jgi:hypothetical protein